VEEEPCHPLACPWAAKAIIGSNSALATAQEVLAAHNSGTTPLATMTEWLALEEAVEEETTTSWIPIFKAPVSAWDPLEAT